MKTYTAFVSKDEAVKESEGTADSRTLRIIDGIAATKRENEFGFALGSGPLWVPFSKTDPPIIINGYVFNCRPEMETSLTIIRSPKPPRHQNTAATPYLIRVYTRCEALTEKTGFFQTLAGKPTTLVEHVGITTEGKCCAKWSDSLVILSLGDAIQIRPAGTTDPTEWVIHYRETGIVSLTLTEYLDRMLDKPASS